jgi:hypothetical protein
VTALGPLDFATSAELEVPENDGERPVWVHKSELMRVPFTHKIEQEATKAYLQGK